MMRPLRVIGLDLSLKATGLAATHSSDGQPRLFTETIYTDISPTRTNIIDHPRVHQVFSRVAKAVECRPDLVVIEKPLIVARTGDVPIRLAELHGLVKHWLYARSIAYVDVDPKHVKQYATGRGNAVKEEVLAAMLARYSPDSACNVKIGDHNAADALSLLAMGLDANGQPLVDKSGQVIVVPDSHRSPLNKVRWPLLKAVS
jgi:crossover junction endodeoxyribonuclease RuvC